MDLSHLSAEDLVIYVDELAGADDYWLSITDAARICRVQDVSIRRAINRKVLPVRQQRAGQNKRTRFVRASDLAKAGFPIIDESAAITTEIGKVDVLSIPRQQQQIVQEHQALMLSLSEMQEALASSQQQMQADLHRQQENVQIALQTAQEQYTRQLSEAEGRIVQEQEKLRHTLTEATQHLADVQQSLRGDLVQAQALALSQNERIQATIATLTLDLTQEQAVSLSRNEHIQTALSTLQTSLLNNQKEVQRQFTEQATLQQNALNDYQQRVNLAFQGLEQETSKRLLEIGQHTIDSLQSFTQTFDDQLAELVKKLSQVQRSNKDLSQSITIREQDLNLALQQQQSLLKQQEQLLPLLPYVHQRLITEQDMAAQALALADLEARLLAAQQRELQHFQPLLSPEHMEILNRLLKSGETLPQ